MALLLTRVVLLVVVALLAGCDDRSPSAHPIGSPSVFDAARAQGRRATTFAEGMPRRCEHASAGRYAARHNPWTYFASATSRRNCSAHDLPAGTPTSGALRDAV